MPARLPDGNSPADETLAVIQARHIIRDRHNLGRKRASSTDPEGVADISRWSSASVTTGKTTLVPATRRGRRTGRNACLSRGCLGLRSATPPGSIGADSVVRWFRCAQPPANISDASGVKNRTGMTRANLCRLENETQNVQLRTLERYARALGCRLEIGLVPLTAAAEKR